MPIIKGVRNLKVAKQTKDDATGRAYDAPYTCGGLQEVDVDTSFKETDVPGDDQTYESMKSFENCPTKIKIAELPLEALPLFEGGTYNEVTDEYDFTKDSDAPIIGVMFKAPRTDGTFQGVKLWCFQCIKVKQGYKTQEHVSVEIEGKCLASTYDGKVHRKKEAPPAAWFDSMEATDDVVAPTVSSSVPADAAAAVAVDANIVWTMDKDILPASVVIHNVLVIKASDGTVVAGTVTWDDAGNTITFNPDADLTAATAYLAILTTQIRSLTGVRLAAPNVINFTTA